MRLNKNKLSRLGSSQFDAVIVGSSFWGLLLAARLSKSGQTVALLEAESNLGGSFKSGLLTDFAHASPSLDGLMDELKDLGVDIGKKLSQSPNPELPSNTLRDGCPEPLPEPQTLDGTRIKSFYGFGDKAPEEYACLLPYLSPDLRHLQALMPAWIDHWISLYGDRVTVIANCPITKIERTEADSWLLRSQAESVVLPTKLVLATPPAVNLRILTVESLPKSARSAALKAPKSSDIWTSIHIKCLVPIPMDSKVDPFARVVLPGTQKEPTWGIAFSRPASPGDTSQLEVECLGFLPGTSLEESEAVGNAIRHLKRQAKKVWDLPVHLDRVGVLPGSHSQVEVNFDGLKGLPIALLHPHYTEKTSPYPHFGGWLQSCWPQYQKLVSELAPSSPTVLSPLYI